MRNERGSILITALIFMLVMTFMLMGFLEMSTTGLKQTTYAEQAKKAFYIADGGLTVAGSAIDMIISEKGVTTVVTNKFPSSLIEFNNNNLYDELMGPAASDVPLDMTVKLLDATATVDIRKVGSAEFAAGTSGEFASGYEGIGGGMSAGGIYLFYNVDVVGRSTLGSKSNIMGIYRKVTGVGGGS
ncbi:MAG: hypothetical protein OHK0040_03580 [bacterium]